MDWSVVEVEQYRGIEDRTTSRGEEGRSRKFMYSTDEAKNDRAAPRQDKPNKGKAAKWTGVGWWREGRAEWV